MLCSPQAIDKMTRRTIRSNELDLLLLPFQPQSWSSEQQVAHTRRLETQRNQAQQISRIMNYAHRDCAGCTDLDCVHQPSPCFIESKPSPTCQTFGIELEFVVVARTDSLTRSVPEFAADWAPTFLTHQAFLAHGIPTFCPGLVCECKKFNPGKERIGDCVKGKVPAMSENSAGGKFGRWSVHIDQSAKLTDEEREFAPEGEYCIYSLELASRCFGAATDTNWQGEVAHVLAVMTSCLRGHGCAVLANDKCGLHVHMGYGDEKVPLGTCKSVLQLMTALERCFDQAHSTPRLAPGPNFTPGGQGHFNANLGYLHRAREAQENGREYDIFSTLANIQAAHGYESMGELFVVEREKEDHVYIQSGHSCTVNFDNTWVERCIRDDGGREISIDPIGTIEFRQHQSTLDVDVIAAWVGLLRALVHFCNKADNDKLVLQLCA